LNDGGGDQVGSAGTTDAQIVARARAEG
jgi:hypothetical protein